MTSPLDFNVRNWQLLVDQEYESSDTCPSSTSFDSLFEDAERALELAREAPLKFEAHIVRSHFNKGI